MKCYVSLNGNDANPGTKAQPFATPTRARDVLRERRKAGELKDAPVTVYLRGGMYRVMDTLELTAEDSGTEKSPVVWQAAPGEEVRLVGGVRLTGFSPVTDSAALERLAPQARGQVLQVDLKAAGVSDFGKPTPVGGSRAELICNSRYMALARYPNDGEWLRIASIPQGGTRYETERDSHYGRFAYDGDQPARWKDTADLWVHGYWVYDWSDQYHLVEKLDLEKKEIWPQPPLHGYGYRKGQRFYFLNVLEELDQPGEWYLDRNTGLLYFWPPCDLAKAEVFFPELQKPMLELKGTQYVRICGITFECSRDTAINVTGGAHNEIAGCAIRNFGAQESIAISGEFNGVRSCAVYELAGTGVSLQGGDRKTLTRGNNYAVNNEIHHVGRVFRTYHGAFNLGGVGNRIGNCYVHDCPHQGIGYGGNDHVIEYCDFTRIATETGDVGVTYTGADWTFMGHEFRYNYFHNIHGPGNLGCFTIYPDLPCGGINLHHNIFYDVDQVFHTNSGRAMLIENNLFLRCRGMSFSTWREDSMFKEGGAWRMVENLKAVNYDQPPYSLRYPSLQQLAEDFAKGEEHVLERELPKGNVVRRNVSWGSSFLTLYPPTSLEHVKPEENVIADEVVFTGSFDGAGKSATYRNGDAALAEEFGKRGNVLLKGDPGFGDLLTQDFRLAADSPAWKVGFEPIPFDKIGLQTDEYRKTIPVLVSDPLVTPPSRTFVSNLTVRITPTPQAGGMKCVLRYTLDGKEPTGRSPAYKRPLRIADTTTVKAAAFVRDGRKILRSNSVTAIYKVMRLDRGGVYLSDLPEQDLFAYLTCWKKDTNHLGVPIKLGGLEYDKGLLLHPDETKEGKGLGRVVYNLDGDLSKAKRFTAVIGIDDSMQGYNLGSATFIVEIHRNGKWERLFESAVLKLGDKPQEINVSITGAGQLRLVTTDGGDGIACDHATWGMAKVE
ncbi:MAG: NPCBM/NEW2 domain-containing protein [Armatimonadetes bacterium]|nr:NPCBM/NEW2 domain-containing protein [Armatimonadota bacterium]